MSILRKNRDSVMAMLEAFVYDPLISWRLLGQNDDDANKSTEIVQTSGTDFIQKAKHKISSQVRESLSYDDDEGIERKQSSMENRLSIDVHDANDENGGSEPDGSGPHRLVRLSISTSVDENTNQSENPR